jgi:uncharacterized iron-regulated membrane protein
MSGLFLIVLSLSGALLIYATDIQHFTQPEKWLVTPQLQPLSYAELIARVEQHSGQNVAMLMPEHNKKLAWQSQLANGRYVSVDPYSGKLLYQYDYYRTLYGFTMALHRWLLWQDDNGAKPFKNVLSTASLLLMCNLLIGLYLWLKPKQPLKRLMIKPKAKLRQLLYQLHTLLGVSFCIPLLLIAFSGMAFNWQQPSQAIIEFITSNQVSSRPKPPSIKVPEQAQLNYQLAIDNALAAFSQGQLYRIYLPQQATAALAVRIKNPGEQHAFSWVWTNPYTGAVLAKYDASQANISTRIWNFRYNFHIGNFAGSLVQLLWLLLAVSLTFFVATGGYFWLKRTKRK